MKTPEQKTAQRARAEARKKRRAQEAIGENRVSKAVTSERHREAKMKVAGMDGVWLENGDGDMEKWRLTLDGHECIVVVKRGEVMSVRRCLTA